MNMACSKRNSNLIKCLIFLVSILIVILVALAITLVRKKADNHVCKSEHCIKISAEVMRYVDKSVNPCDDFHAFSCERFAKNHKGLPQIEPKEELDISIAEPISINDTRTFVMQKAFYQSCLNLGAIEMDNDETILNFFYGLGEWPVLKGANWSGTYFDWTDVAIKSRRLGFKVNWFLDFSVYEDYNNTRTYVLQIDVPQDLRSLKPNESSLRKKLFTEVAINLGAPTYLAHYETARTIEFEDALGLIAERHHERMQGQDLRMLPKITINEVQILWQNIQWLELINNITGNRMIGSDYVIFNILDYVQDLNQLIYGTPKRIVADYMLWKIVEENWQFFSLQIREKFMKYNEAISLEYIDEDRQKFCINESKKQFPLVADSVYIRRHVTEQKRQLVREMLFIIQSKFIKMLNDATWMRRDSKQRALAKLEDTKFLVGGSDELFDEFGFAEKIGLYGFAFKSSNMMHMLMERKLQFYEKQYMMLSRGIANNTLTYYEKIINISNVVVIHDNTIIIPAAMLRDIYYNPKLPNYYNYATLGKLMAQELFNHVFLHNRTSEDEQDERNFDTIDVFEQATKCLARESYHHPDFKKPKRIKEQLSNFIAVDIAYESYKEWSLINPRESSLAALDFTSGQLFWIHTSKLSCNKIYNRRDNDLSRFKIIGPLRNSKHFANEFLCLEGSIMNPRIKCRIL